MDYIIEQLLNHPLFAIILLVLPIAMLVGYQLAKKEYIKEREDLLSGIFFIGDEDGDNPDIEYE